MEPWLPPSLVLQLVASVIVIKLLLLLTARSAPKKIEKQSIANDTFMFIYPVIYM